MSGTSTRITSYNVCYTKLLRIKQVEVVKGPNSTLWGANAAGGIVNITTKSPFERKGGVVKLGVGNYDTQSYHLSYSNDVKEKLYYTISGSRRQSDNFV